MERIEELDETSDIQAVVAAVRNRADEIRGNLGPKNLWEERVERADELMEIADRIDAASKREAPFRYTAKLIGIVHKMRGAFEKILEIEGYGAPWIEAKTIAQKALEIALPDRRYAQNPESLSNTAKIRAALEEIIDALNEARTEGRIEHWEYSNLFDICDAALAAPPRNCDRFPTYVDAVAYFNEHNQPLRAEMRPNLIDGKQYANMSSWLMDMANGAEKGGE